MTYKKDKEYITIDTIRSLFKKHWGSTLSRSSIYFYINKHGFPPSTGHGRPRLWEKEKVKLFFAKNK